jgi:RNA polymerase sigma-70 factor (ECF subfamily)
METLAPKAAVFLEERTDEELMEAIAEGARDALAILFRRYAVIVRNVSRRILRHDAEADDLVQDVFIFVFRKASLFKKATHGTARSWLVQVTYHRAFNKRSYLNTRHFGGRNVRRGSVTCSLRRNC